MTRNHRNHKKAIKKTIPIIDLSKYKELTEKDFPKFLCTRQEVLSGVKKVMKHWGYHELSLEDTNKFSFKINDVNLWDIITFMVDIEKELGIKPEKVNIEADDENGFWLIFYLESSPSLPAFPLGKKRLQKVGRLKGMWVK